MWQPIEAWWAQRSQRERWLLSVMGALFLVWLFFWLIWRPLHDAHGKAQVRLSHAQSQWQWLNDQLAEHEALFSQARKRPSPTRLVAWLREVVRMLRIQGRVRLMAGHAVLEIERATPEAMAALLNRMQRQSVRFLTVELVRQDGYVQGKLEVVP